MVTSSTAVWVAPSEYRAGAIAGRGASGGACYHDSSPTAQPADGQPRCRRVDAHTTAAAFRALRGEGGHTLIFLASGAGILETLRADIRGRPSRATGPAIAATIGEGIVLVANGNHCSLTGLADELGAADGRVSDIFLPAWFARHLPSICATLFGFGLGRLIEAQARDVARQPAP